MKKLLLVLFLLLMPAVVLAGTFGNTGEGTSSEYAFTMASYCTFANCPATGTVTKMHVKVVNASSTTAHHINVGYYDNAYNHIAHGTSIEVAASFDGWKEIPVSGAITATNTYNLSIQKDSADIHIYYAAGGVQQNFDTTGDYDTWPVTNGTFNAYQNSALCIYIEYTAGTTVNIDTSDMGLAATTFSGNLSAGKSNLALAAATFSGTLNLNYHEVFTSNLALAKITMSGRLQGALPFSSGGGLGLGLGISGGNYKRR